MLSNGDDTGGICFEAFSSQNVNWEDANTTCAGNGGRLANILNEEMNDEIHIIISDSNEHWIGLSRTSNTAFQWSDGSSLTYEKWSSGHPIDGMHCVSVHTNSIEWFSREL